MIKQIIFILLVGTSAWALTLEEAIQRAMLHNPLMKQYTEQYRASRANSSVADASFAPSLDLAYGYSAYSKPSFVGANASSSATAILSYNLFNGFKDSALFKSAQSKEQLAFYQKKAAKEDLKLRVSKAYINYLRRLAEIEIAKDAVKLLERQYRDAKNFQDQGIFAKNEALQVNVERLTAKQFLLKSKKNVELARLTLKRELGGQLRLYETLEPLKPMIKKLALDRLEYAMYFNRSELKSLELQKKDTDFQNSALSSEYLPSVDVNLKYQVAGDDVVPNGGVSFLRHDETSYGVSLKWNLYQGGKTKYQKQNLRYQSLALQESVKDLRLQLQLQLAAATQTYELAKEQIEVATVSLEQAKENYRIVNNQFKANIASTTLLLEAQKLLTNAKVAFHQASFASYDAMAEIERIVEKDIF
jgi:outer membrane protein TolC